MTNKKQVLIITYYWPPSSGPGVQRWLKFAKYLDAYNWTPIILTVKNGSYPNVDLSLEDDISDEVLIHKTRAMEPFRMYNLLRGKTSKSVEVGMGNLKNNESALNRMANYIRANYFIPDARIGWNPFALKMARKIIRQDQVDAIITTGPPHSTHLIGLKLKKEFAIPWVADFRDPWTTVYYNQYLRRSKRSILKDELLENKVLKKADHILVVGKSMKEEFVSRTRNITVVSNGFDSTDIPATKELPTDYFYLSYVGNMKINQNIENLWTAISELQSNVEGFSTFFRLRLTGNCADGIKKEIEIKELQDMIIQEPFLPHKEAIDRMNHSNLLLLPVPKVSYSKSLITGKIFEYLASGTPILAIGPVDGDAANILKTCERQKMIAYDDLATIKLRISEEFLHWKQLKRTRKVRSEAYKIFDRKELCQTVSHILDQLVNPYETT